MTLTEKSGADLGQPRRDPVSIAGPYRARYHFSPERGWLNDPNGLVYYRGEFHLFYQFFPDGLYQGPMHWGHAVSEDLVNWTHLPVALYPDELGYIYSGSAVIDWNNTAGFGHEAMVAAFTHHHHESADEVQSIAYSLDRGRSWTKYPGNPVIPVREGYRDFRDPKVVWYDRDDGGGHWVMALAAGTSVLFYTSPNLVDWEPSGSFGAGYGSAVGVWETPDLFPLRDAAGERRWVLLVGVGAGAPAGGSGVQYFVGDFDGQTFTSANPIETILWLDYGGDNYATQSWSDVPDGRRVVISWMSNWLYGREIPATSTRGAMTLPRALELTPRPDGHRLIQRPVAELRQLRRRARSHDRTIIPADGTLTVESSGRLLEIDARIALRHATPDRVGIALRYDADHAVRVGYMPEQRSLFLDRSASGEVGFGEGFGVVHHAPLELDDGMLRLHVFVDHVSVELFANDGRVTISDLVFPPESALRVELFAEGGECVLESLDLYELEPATFLRTTR